MPERRLRGEEESHRYRTERSNRPRQLGLYAYSHLCSIFVQIEDYFSPNLVLGSSPTALPFATGSSLSGRNFHFRQACTDFGGGGGEP